MAQGYYCWQPASGTPRIRIAPEAMTEIKAHVMRGFKSLPTRGAEIGGALLGSFDSEQGQVTIDGFEPVAIEYRFGPSYIFSDTDRARWSDWIGALREASPRIVGLCRSHTRPGLRVAAEDGDLIRHFLPAGDGVLLLVKPLSDRECVAGFFPFHRGIVADGATPSREFPFGEAQRPPEAPPATSPVGTTAKPLSRWVIVSAIAAGLCAAGALHYATGPSSENPIPGPSHPINSSSDPGAAKPAVEGPASAETGDRAGAGTASAGRVLNGITSKASHLWPFHSVKQAPPTR